MEIKLTYMGTVCKFQDFSITYILREINFEDSESAKSALLTHFEPLNCEFLHYLKAEIYPNYQNSDFSAPKIAKFRSFNTSNFSKRV